MYLCASRSKIGVRKFYEDQKELVEAWKEDLKQLHRTSPDERLAENKERQLTKVWDTRLTVLSMVLNVILIGAKTTAAILTNSLAIIASVVDSAMDITCGIVLWYTCRLIEKSNKHRYPVGLNRLEPLTILIVGLIMVFANLVVIERAASDTITDYLHPDMNLPSLVILCIGTATKAVLFVICRARNTATSRILATDHRNDCFTNIVAVAGAYIGHHWWKYADPIGATLVSSLTALQSKLDGSFIVIMSTCYAFNEYGKDSYSPWEFRAASRKHLGNSAASEALSVTLCVLDFIKDDGFIIVTWLLTVKEQVPLLIGKTASPQLINRIVHVAISHDERIKHLDTVFVYHFGANFLVELHVVMDRELSLCEAHDVSERLQAKLEQLKFVERAFVHCDYEFDGDEHV